MRVLLSCYLLGLIAGELVAGCEICGGPFADDLVYTVRDRWRDIPRQICSGCADLSERCAVCRVPVRAGRRDLGDGRLVCGLDEGIILIEEEEARRYLDDAVELDRTFARFLRLPSTNVTLEFVNQLHMHQVLRSPGFDRSCPYMIGYTRSERASEEGWHHRIALLSGLPRSELLAVYAHELGHAWLKEHLPAGRDLSRLSEEGFCEMLAYRFMETLGDREQISRIERNGYTEGRLRRFVNAYALYDLQRILEWLQYGTRSDLGEDPDTIRELDEVARAAKVRAGHAEELERGEEGLGVSSWKGSVDSECLGEKGELRLTGLAGRGNRRFALVNGEMFEERGESWLWVRGELRLVECVEIGRDQVRVKWVGTGEEEILRMRE